MNDEHRIAHELTVEPAKQPGSAVSHKYCERLMDRITDLGSETSSNWLAAMWSFLSVAGAAGITLLVVPESDRNQLPDYVIPALWGVLAAGLVIGLVCFIGHRSRRSQRRDVARDIVEELAMHTNLTVPTRPLQGLKGLWAKLTGSAS